MCQALVIHSCHSRSPRVMRAHCSFIKVPGEIMYVQEEAVVGARCYRRNTGSALATQPSFHDGRAVCSRSDSSCSVACGKAPKSLCVVVISQSVSQSVAFGSWEREEQLLVANLKVCRELRAGCKEQSISFMLYQLR